MNKQIRIHIAKVVALACVVCRNEKLGESPAIPHHINCQGMGMKSSDYEVIPLCSKHHQGGGHGVSVHDGLEEFEKRYGTERELLEQVYNEIGFKQS